MRTFQGIIKIREMRTTNIDPCEGLPEDFGGCAHVAFCSRFKLTNPASCVAYQWTFLLRETHAKSVEVIQQFQFLLQQVIGKKAITVSRANEQQSSTIVLPAIGLISGEILSLDPESAMKNAQNHYKRQPPEDVTKQKVINRMKQRNQQRTKAPRVKSQRVKCQGVKREQMK